MILEINEFDKLKKTYISYQYLLKASQFTGDASDRKLDHELVLMMERVRKILVKFLGEEREL